MNKIKNLPVFKHQRYTMQYLNVYKYNRVKHTEPFVKVEAKKAHRSL